MVQQQPTGQEQGHVALPGQQGSIANWTGAPTNPTEKVELRKMTLNFYVRNAKIFSIDQLKTYKNLS